MIDKNRLNEIVIEYTKKLLEELRQTCRMPKANEIQCSSTTIITIENIIRFSEYLYNREHMTKEGDDEN